jgi:hypothetical protein
MLLGLSYCSLRGSQQLSLGFSILQGYLRSCIAVGGSQLPIGTESEKRNISCNPQWLPHNAQVVVSGIGGGRVAWW